MISCRQALSGQVQDLEGLEDGSNRNRGRIVVSLEKQAADILEK